MSNLFREASKPRDIIGMTSIGGPLEAKLFRGLQLSSEALSALAMWQPCTKNHWIPSDCITFLELNGEQLISARMKIGAILAASGSLSTVMGG